MLLAMAATGVPFDLAAVKLAVPFARPGTVAKRDVIARLSNATVPLCDHRCASRVRQDHSSGAVGRGRPASVRVACARPGTTTMPWCSCEISRPRFIGSSRCCPTWWTRCPARLHRPGESVTVSGTQWLHQRRPLVLVLDDLHAVAGPACLDVLTELFAYDPRLPDRHRQQRRAALPLPVAGPGIDGRDRRRGYPAGRGGGPAAPRGGRRRARRGRSRRADRRTEGWPAGLYLAALSLQAGAKGTEGAGGSAAMTGSSPSTSSPSSCRGCRRPRPSSSSTPRCWTGCPASSVTPCSRRPDRRPRSRSWSDERLPGAPRPARRVAPLSPSVRPDASRRARTQRARPSRGTQQPGDVLVHCERFAGGGPRLRAGRGQQTPPPGWLTILRCPSTTRAKATLEEWLGWFSDEELPRYPTLAVYGAWLRALTGRAADAERWLSHAEGSTSAIPLADGSRHRAKGRRSASNMMRNGVEQALAGADLALSQFSSESIWRSTTLPHPRRCARVARRRRIKRGTT